MASSEGGGERESETEQRGDGGGWGERFLAVALGGENCLKKDFKDVAFMIRCGKSSHPAPL